MIEKTHSVDDVFGVARDVPLNYVARAKVDDKLIGSLTRDHHIVIYGSSKQGKTCLRKHCLKPTDYIVVSCQNRWSLSDLHSSILKEAGYVTKLSSVKTSSGHAKISVSAEAKGKVPLVAEANAQGAGEVATGESHSEKFVAMQLDPYDVNDIIRGLNGIDFDKYIVLEDFHYLPDESQRDFSFALKAFHENSRFCFIIVGVWRENNRLIGYNGDLVDRVYSVDVDSWSRDGLSDVIDAGECLLNVKIEEKFRNELLDACFDSVHLVQEACRRCCRHEEVFRTQLDRKMVGGTQSATEIIREVVDEQGGRYMGFLMNFSDGFQQTDLEMPRWVVYAILRTSVDRLKEGVRLREVARLMKLAHPRGESLNNGNITQILKSAAALQIKKNIRPIVVDYDASNLNLNVVDKGFLTWLANQDVRHLLEELGLPEIA